MVFPYHCLVVFFRDLLVYSYDLQSVDPPLSTSFMSLSPSSTGNLLFGLLISGISSCLTSLNFWTTILNLRSYYLTLKTMPLFLWALLIVRSLPVHREEENPYDGE